MSVCEFSNPVIVTVLGELSVRNCSDGSTCPPACFANPEVFLKCSTHIYYLKDPPKKVVPPSKPKAEWNKGQLL